MKPSRVLSFFLRTLSLELKAHPQDPNEFGMIQISEGNQNVKNGELALQLDWTLVPFRDAAYRAFYEKVLDNVLPIFTLEEIDPTEFNQQWMVDFTLATLNLLTHHYLIVSILDDDIDTVRALLKVRPELLLDLYPRPCLSELTKQIFTVSNKLGIAAQRRQITMIKTLLEFFPALLANTEFSERARSVLHAGLNQWPDFTINQTGEIQPPEEYTLLCTNLVTQLMQHPFSTDPRFVNYAHLCDEFEDQMDLLYSILIPNFDADDDIQDIKTPDNKTVDIELLLIAAIQTYCRNIFRTLLNHPEQASYCIRVIGLLQKFLPKETARFFSQVSKAAPSLPSLSPNLELTLWNNKPYYDPRADLKDRLGLGFSFSVPGMVRGDLRSGYQLMFFQSGNEDRFVQTLVEKQQEFHRIKAEMNQTLNVSSMSK